MSKLPVNIDYVKVAQYVKQIEYYLARLKKELDDAVRNERTDTTTNSDT